ncbi:hypothetical protein V8C34DRAFT_277629 [Trichoderma compactum]
MLHCCISAVILSTRLHGLYLNLVTYRLLFHLLNKFPCPIGARIFFFLAVSSCSRLRCMEVNCHASRLIGTVCSGWSIQVIDT